MYQTILFDLDGTLTDSKIGILNCLRYAFEQMSRPVPDDSVLTQFIGPPLQNSFAAFCGMSPTEVQEAIRLFRERYTPIGVYENEPAPGMLALCRRLRDKGRTLGVASSKPEPMCQTVCRHFGFAETMSVIVGSPLDADWTKSDILQEACRRLHLTDADLPAVLMVGDRKYDVEGARTCGIDCVGVEFFGYAGPGELEAAGAVAVCRTADELEAFL